MLERIVGIALATASLIVAFVGQFMFRATDWMIFFPYIALDFLLLIAGLSFLLRTPTEPRKIDGQTPVKP